VIIKKSTQPGEPSGEHITKKTYASPRLVVYGDLRTITATRTRSGGDGGLTVGHTFSM
jgi:hypothetical protein